MPWSSLVGALALTAVVVVVRVACAEVLARIDGPLDAPPREKRGALAWCLAVALLAVAPLKLGVWLAGIERGALATALICLPLAMLGVRRAGGLSFSFSIRSRAVLIVTVVLGALLTHVTLTTYLWDEGSAHFGVPAAMARGALPAVLPLFPEVPFSYHLGYDVLVALVRAFVRLPPEWSCDVVTLASAALLLAMLVHVGRILGGDRGAALAPVLGLLGYGAAALCLADGWGVGLSCSAWFPSSWVSAQRLPPPVVSSFFQHPQGLGAPLLLASLVLALEKPSAARTALTFALVTLLSQTQVVMAALAWGGVGLGAMVHAAQTRDRRLALVTVGSAALALVGARALGGLAAEQGTFLRFDGGYFDDAGAALVLHNLALLGMCALAAPLSLALAVFPVVRAQTLALRLALAAIVVVAFVLPNIARYERSWDIIKFFAVGALCANVLLTDAVSALFDRGRIARVVAAALVAVAIPSGVFWLLRHGPLNGVVSARYTESAPSELGRALDAKFGDVIGTGRVLSSDPSIHQLGFLVVGHDWRRAEQGYTFDRVRADALTVIAQRARRSLALDDLRALRVDFVLLSARDRAALTEDGQAVLAGLEALGDVRARGTLYLLFRVRRSL